MTRNQKSLILNEVHDSDVLLDTREIFFHSFYEQDDPGVDYRQADIFIKNLRMLLSLSSEKPILVHLNSIGGDWHAGMAIYDAILTCPAPVTILGYGIVASIATVILQAADTRVLMPNTSFLIHYGYESMFGTHTEAMSYGEFAAKCRERMLDIYCKSTIKTPLFKNEKLARQFIDAKIKDKSDWWLTAQEAVNYGFADGIFQQPGFEEISSFHGVL